MAKIIESVLIVKFSKLVKDDVDVDLISEDVQIALEQVAQELSGEGIIVEVEKA